MTKLIPILLVSLLNIVIIQNVFAEITGDFVELNALRTILEKDEEQLDLAEVKFSIDKLIVSSIDVKSELTKIDKMVADIQSMLLPESSAMEKMLAVKKYIYTPGEWNNYKAYQYDFDDPLGTKITNKLLSNYIKNKKGNCVTMPFLFIILGDRLGINVTASIAPLHVLVMFTDTDGKRYNLETTSGAGFTRDTWYRKQMPMTEKAIENGIYLQPLTKKETVAVMMTILAEYFFQEEEYKKSVAISDLTLKYYPKYVNSMLRNGSAFYRLLQESFVKKYPNSNNIPKEQRELFHFLSKGNRYWFAKAEELGWQEPKPDFNAEYLQKVRHDAKNNTNQIMRVK